MKSTKYDTAQSLPLRQIFNLTELKALLCAFYDMTGFPMALADAHSGELIVESAWAEACCAFHRKDPQSRDRCRASVERLTAALDATSGVRLDACDNGLMDACIPIVIAGQHRATLFTGHFLLAPPDRQFFHAQAQRFGYATASYLEAIERSTWLSAAKLTT